MKAVLTFLGSRRYLVIVAFSLLQACSLQQHQLNDLAQTLDNGNASQVLTVVEQKEYAERDFAQYKLTLGLLRAVNGDFAGGISELQAAKTVINQLQATSISENVGAITVNETLRSYTSTASERMLLQQLLILSYLMADDLDGARVEVLQMQELAKALPDSGLSGLVSSSYYLGGLVYELGRETDNAMISYRQAYQVMQTTEMPIPGLLQDSLLLSSQQLGLKSEHQKYVSAFGRDLKPLDKNQSQLVLIYWGGVVSAKQERYLSVYEPSLGYNISLALPYYAENYVKPKPWHFTVLGKTTETEIFDDVNLLARADLDAESAAIYAAALARVIIKQTALHEVEKNDKDGIATLLLNITTMVSERADVRSWNMLPASIQVQRFALDAGTYYLQQPSLNQGLSVSDIEPVNLTLANHTASIDNAFNSAQSPKQRADAALNDELVMSNNAGDKQASADVAESAVDSDGNVDVAELAVDSDGNADAAESTVDSDENVDAAESTVDSDENVDAAESTVDSDENADAAESAVDSDENVDAAESAVDSDESVDAAESTVDSDVLVMTNIANVAAPGKVEALLLKPGKTVLLFYSSAAKKAYHNLSP